MAANTGKLAGRTIFISGASRGIGKAIALKCAKDGANVAIAAKTATANPKLPGTIYTAAQEIEDAGGKALPCIVDIQSEEQVKAAISETVKKFGGIDILINNASAIHMTGTVATPMKRYDLMHSVNTRGTFLCSKYAAPYLKDGKNPHILNISPPLNMNPRWFKDHVAYTMAKYGMSLCVLGMAEEFREDKIAVNALWPQTAIYTAAMAMLGGGEGVRSQCRSVDIMSDAAYVMLTKDSGNYTGNFAIDEKVLKEVGITDFTQYNEVPDATPLPDFFIEEVDPLDLKQQMEEAGAQLRFGHSKGATDAEEGQAAEPAGGSSPVAKTFQVIESMMGEELVKSMNAVYSFNITDAEEWYMDLKNGSGSSGQGSPPSGKADVTFVMDSDSFVKMFQGKINPTTAFMTGKMKIKGDLGMAMKLEKLMKQARSKL